MKRALWVAAGGLTAVVAIYLSYVAFQIQRQSTIDEARPADIIIIMGAAEYRGRPSPVFRARLDHGLELLRQKLAARVMTTGGAGGDPIFTEGDVGRAYLISKGVPSEAIIVEPEGESTAYSVAAAGEIMRRMNLKSCIVVSDGYHIYRLKKMLEFRGLKVYGSPRASMNQGQQWTLYLRQAVGYLLWEVGITI
jgi:uncharacterized SAM-binding protein YcdF (DUF218 family)